MSLHPRPTSLYPIENIGSFEVRTRLTFRQLDQVVQCTVYTVLTDYRMYNGTVHQMHMGRIVALSEPVQGFTGLV